MGLFTFLFLIYFFFPFSIKIKTSIASKKICGFNLHGDVEVEGKGGAGGVWVGADAGALDGLARSAGHAAA